MHTSFSAKITCVVIATMCVARGAHAADDIAKVHSLSHDCAAGKQKACSDLTKIAVDDKRPSIRRAAVGNLADQTILIRIALDDADAEIRGDAAARITDPALLARIAIESPEKSVRIAATGKITDQQLLVKVASESKDINERIAIVPKISDLPALTKLAFEDRDAGMRKAATDKLLQTIDVSTLTTLLTVRPDIATLTDSQGSTALLWAAFFGHKDVAELLLAHNAPVNAKSQRGATPLYAAAQAGHIELVQLLLAHNADIDARMNSGYSALHTAAEKGYKDVVELLLAKGAPINSRDHSGATPLHAAAAGGHTDVVQFLVTKGAGISDMDNYSETPIKYAAEHDHADVVEFLRQQGGRLRTASRNMKLSERNGETFVGDVPLILSAYGPNGDGAAGLSADYSNTIVYYVDLSSNPMFGVQVDARQNAAASVSFSRKVSASAFIDSAGIVFPGEVTQVDESGPSITIEFQDSNNKSVPVPSGIQIKTRGGVSLRIRPVGDNLLTVENVPPEPLQIAISNPGSPSAQWTGVLFPKFRSAKAGVVIYSLRNVLVP